LKKNIQAGGGRKQERVPRATSIPPRKITGRGRPAATRGLKGEGVKGDAKRWDFSQIGGSFAG